jgi:hypothetical protein
MPLIGWLMIGQSIEEEVEEKLNQRLSSSPLHSFIFFKSTMQDCAQDVPQAGLRAGPRLAVHGDCVRAD